MTAGLMELTGEGKRQIPEATAARQCAMKACMRCSQTTEALEQTKMFDTGRQCRSA